MKIIKLLTVLIYSAMITYYSYNIYSAYKTRKIDHIREEIEYNKYKENSPWSDWINEKDSGSM